MTRVRSSRAILLASIAAIVAGGAAGALFALARTGEPGQRETPFARVEAPSAPRPLAVTTVGLRPANVAASQVGSHVIADDLRDANAAVPVPATEFAPPCATSERCGLARACVGGRCIPCRADSECAVGEVCVLAHCVISRLAACARDGDCREGTCVLTGLSAGARGNEDMRAICLPLRGPSGLAPTDVPPRTAPAAPIPVQPGVLIEELPGDSVGDRRDVSGGVQPPGE